MSVVLERVKLGLVGLNFGRHIVSDLLAGPPAHFIELIALCDQNEERLAEAGRKADLTRYTQLSQLLADDRVEAIGLFTGPVGRAEIIRRCLSAGKHVMTTKPLETDALAALAVLKEAQSAGLAVHLNSPSPTAPPNIGQIIRWQQEHQLGRAIAARTETWASYRETADGTWYDDPDQCPVAPIFRLGIYAVNDLLWLFGSAALVTVLQSRLLTGRPTPDNAQLGLQFESGAIANVFASFCIDDGNPHHDSMTINFQNGTIYQNVGISTSVKKGGAELRLIKADSSGNPFVAAEAGVEIRSGKYDWQLFQRAVRGETVVGELAPKQIVESLTVIAAMKEAAATSRVTSVVH